MIAVATTASSAGSGAGPAATTVGAYDAWGVDGRGATQPRGSHATLADAHSAGAVVIHGRAVAAVRLDAPDVAVDRILLDVLRVDLAAIRRELDAAVATADVVTTWLRHADALRRAGDRARTRAWLVAVSRAQDVEPRITAEELRRRIAARLDHPAPRRGRA